MISCLQLTMEGLILDGPRLVLLRRAIDDLPEGRNYFDGRGAQIPSILSSNYSSKEAICYRFAEKK
ncbi:hypothetical protein CASFOL_012574 [Castilleja foliolosa]|uniref:Uncharacterized protein n=1 Tax=Castilleja foliolosa TaxID=1961234 RepID=A0ABD3CQB2_9LAMI